MGLAESQTRMAASWCWRLLCSSGGSECCPSPLTVWGRWRLWRWQSGRVVEAVVTVMGQADRITSTTWLRMLDKGEIAS